MFEIIIYAVLIVIVWTSGFNHGLTMGRESNHFEYETLSKIKSLLKKE